MVASPTTLFRMFFSLFLCLFTLPLSSLAIHSNYNQAEKLIRQLNLFPKHSINLVPNDDESSLATSSPQIVEKQFNFNLLGDPGPSVQDFGHHAGYYRLPYTKGAR